MIAVRGDCGQGLSRVQEMFTQVNKFKRKSCQLHIFSVTCLTHSLSLINSRDYCELTICHQYPALSSNYFPTLLLQIRLNSNKLEWRHLLKL